MTSPDLQIRANDLLNLSDMNSNKTLIPRADSLPTEVARRLRSAILLNELKGGERLPSELALCSSYGVSRPVVREALSLLKSEDLIVSRQGRGQFVNPEGGGVFRIEPDFRDRESLASMFEFLLSVEVASAELAAQRRSTAELNDIRSSLDELDTAIKLGLPGADEDMRFHRSIVLASHNVYFIEFSSFLETRVRKLIRYARLNTARQSTHLVAAVQIEHEAIFRAIEKQDVTQARKAATAHLRKAAIRLRSYHSP